MLVLLVGTGIFLTFRLGFWQFKMLPYALKLAFSKSDSNEEGDISHFSALMTALAATIGTGNIAGVATAIAAGGPGAVFWMWITALVGMATKYGEAIVAVKYRIVNENGEMSGGPMFALERGLKMKWLGVLFALFGALAAFGIGNMVQANSVADAINLTFGVPKIITGIILAAVTAFVVLGGIKSIGRVADVLVPVMAVFYILAALVILIINAAGIPEAFSLILSNAFSPAAATGGFVGATVKLAIQKGVSRGVFSNEAGLGSAPIAAAAAKTDIPAKQALVSMTGTFIDTIVVCSMTALCILTTGAWKIIDPATGKGLTAVALTKQAFSTGLPGTWGGLIVSIGIIFFAYSTILGWAYYGEKCAEYLAGVKIVKPYRYLWVIFVVIGSAMQLGTVWTIADILNALMAFPNLVCLLGLSGVIAAESKSFLEYREKEKKSISA